ncbi:MAG: HK97 family phage prohead protease [Syntrophobacteria bacterium]|jgi:HK97 family phage prohead protease
MSVRSYFEARLLRANKDKAEIFGEIPYNRTSDDLGGFYEILRPGVFAESLKSGAKVVSLWQHDHAKPLGNTQSGTLVLTDTPSALKVRIIPPNTTWGKDALESIRRGDVSGFSFGFVTKKDNWPETNLREVLKADLVEVSPVTFPAYAASIALARSKARGCEQDEGIIARQAKTPAVIFGGPPLLVFPSEPAEFRFYVPIAKEE